MQVICIDWKNAFYTLFHNKVLNVHMDNMRNLVLLGRSIIDIIAEGLNLTLRQCLYNSQDFKISNKVNVLALHPFSLGLGMCWD